MDVTEFSKELLPLVLCAGESVSKLAGESGQDLSYYNALYPNEVASGIKNVTAKLADVAEKIRSLESGQDSGKVLNIADDYAEKIVDVLDGFLEEAVKDII